MTSSSDNTINTDTHRTTFGLAIVGCGQIATHHLDAIASRLQGKVVLRALCDPSAERRAVLANLSSSRQLLPLLDDGDGENFSSPCPPNQYNDMDELIFQDMDRFNTEIDIIFIAVPHDLHESLAMKALSQTSKIVVLEKPLAPTLESCDNLVAASENILLKEQRQRQQQSQQQQQQLESSSSSASASSMLIVAEQSPYWESVALARQLIADGAIGRVVTGAAYYYESMRDNITSGSVDANTGNLGWRGSIARAGGGIAIDGGLHWIRPLREMLGRIEHVTAVTRYGLAPELGMEGETLAHAMFQIQAPPVSAPSNHASSSLASPFSQPEGSGCLTATFSCNMLATAPMAHDMCPYFRITGTKGELVIGGDGLAKDKPGAGGLRLYDETHPSGTDLLPKDRVGGFFLGFAGLWSEVYRICIEQDYEKAHETVVRAADDVRTVLAMYRSAESGRWESTRM
jgi:predicted dehydrogenase